MAALDVAIFRAVGFPLVHLREVGTRRIRLAESWQITGEKSPLRSLRTVHSSNGAWPFFALAARLLDTIYNLRR